MTCGARSPATSTNRRHAANTASRSPSISAAPIVAARISAVRSGSGSSDSRSQETRADRTSSGLEIVAEPDDRQQDRAHRPVGQALPVRQALGDRDAHGRFEPIEELLEQPGLPDPGRRHDADQVRTSLVERATGHQLQLVEIGIAPDDPGSGRALQAGRDADEQAGGDRSSLALRLDLDRWSELEPIDHGADRSLAHQDRPRLGGLLETSRGVDRIPGHEDGGVLVARGDDLATVDAEADRNAVHEVRIRADAVSELQRRREGPRRVVIVGDRRAEDGHDRVADELLDVAAVALHGVGRDREQAPQERPARPRDPAPRPAPSSRPHRRRAR